MRVLAIFVAAMLLVLGTLIAERADSLVLLSHPVVASCAPSGPGSDAANDVAAAGLSTCVRYNDFTTTIPNVVGTGLPSSWLDCNNPSTQTDTGYLWYWGAAFATYGGTLPCNLPYVGQTTDTGGGGNLALVLHDDGTCNNSGGSCTTGIFTFNWAGTTPISSYLPDGVYTEVTFRMSDNVADANHQFPWWSDARQGSCPYPWGGGAEEIDFVQPGVVGSHLLNPAWVDWPCVSGGGFSGPPNTDTNYSLYHTFGTLLTNGNGGTQFSMCSYLDGTRYGCGTSSYRDSLTYLERRYLLLMNGVTTGSAGHDMYVKSIKLITCKNWQTLSSSCAGSAYNGNFFTGAGG